jgi:phosphoribosylformylglycinamidine (FGAM) synthase-like amidotransferase family enzyme
MISPRVLILRAPGTNCDEETAHAFSLAGGMPERRHINAVLGEPARIADFQILCIPGGFSYGDDVAAGRILGNQIRHHLADALLAFRDAGKLILGICNGFQVLLKTGLLAAEDDRGPVATLAWNDSGRFEDRWTRLGVQGGKCVFLAGIDEMDLPVAHAEGKFVTRDAAALDALGAAGQLVLRYRGQGDKETRRQGEEDAHSLSTPLPLSLSVLPYPDNPNGAMGNVAGICDATGQVLGLMPHPERFVDPTQHPHWTVRPKTDAGDGLRVFQNAVRYFQ